MNRFLIKNMLISTMVSSVFGWNSGSLTVETNKSPMAIKVTAGDSILIEITGFSFGTTRYTNIAAVMPATDSMLLKLSSETSVVVTGVDGGLRFTSTNPAVPSVTITLKDQGEHFYGITQHNIETNPDLRGKSNIHDRVTAYKRNEEDAEVYSGFYFTTLGYAAYFDSFANGTYSFGVSNATTITYNTSTIDWYLFYGPTLSKIQKSYFKVIGAPRWVPMWACGPFVWHDDYSGSAMILDHAEQFTAAKIPYSTIWLDRPYNNGSNGWSNMNFEGSFGNPAKWITTLADKYYVNLVTWIMPGTFSGASPAGAFTGTDNHYLDLTDPAQVEWYRDKLKTGQYAYGIKGHKLDRIDNGWGSAGQPAFKDGTPAPQRHKKYAYLNCKVTDEFLSVDAGLGKDCFIFPRCAVARCQQYMGAIWNGDTYADWSGLNTSIGNAFRAGILGFPMWGSDICGYTQKRMPSIENYSRWLLFGIYSGFMELMLDGKEPWKLSTENQAIVRNIFNQRFDLLPYIYSIINTSAENGVTMKPLVGEYPGDPKTYSLTDEYLFGPSMLVAPLLSNASSRSVYLPKGKWVNKYDWADEQEGATTITSPAQSLTQIPVYLKTNSIHPTGKVFGGLSRKWEPSYNEKRSIDINAIPGSAGEHCSFTYVDYIDEDKHKDMTLAVHENNAITIEAPAMNIPGNVIVRLTAAPVSVYLGTTRIETPDYNATRKKLTIPFPVDQPIQVMINDPPIDIAKTFEAVKISGSFTATRHGRYIQLTIPSITGTSVPREAEVNVFSLTGRTILKQNMPLNRHTPTPISIASAKGIFFVQATIGARHIGALKIILP